MQEMQTAKIILDILRADTCRRAQKLVATFTLKVSQDILTTNSQRF